MRNLNDYQEKYNKLKFERYQVAYRRKKVISLLNEYKHNNILEIGCGMEPIFEHYCDFDKLIVVEPCEEFYKNLAKSCRGNSKVHSLQSTFPECVEEIKRHCDKIDYIILSSLLHEIENPSIFLQEMKALCQKETTIHINVPNAKSIHRLLAVEMGLIENEFIKSNNQNILQQKTTYCMETLVQECEKAGFNIIDKGSYFVKFFTHEQMQLCLDSKIFESNLLNGLDNLIKYMPEYGSEIYVQCNGG